MSEGSRKSETPEKDPAKLMQMLELEMMQQRATWQRVSGRRTMLRAASVLFFLAVIAAALIAFFIFLSPDRVQELREKNASASTPTATPLTKP